MQRYILALDQGTSSSRAILFDDRGVAVAAVAQAFTQIYPKPGWVEQNPEEIWSSQLAVARAVIAQAGVTPQQVAGIGITNQRETTIVWDRATGRPVCNAIVWQCRRTAPMCERLKAEGYEDLIRERTGLVLDAYFSGTKVAWILRDVEGVRARAERGELAFGTVDSWLIWNLTGGKVHATDASNASRTMLFDIQRQAWDEDLLGLLDIPLSMMPDVVDSSMVVGNTTADLFGAEIPIAGVAGDQQAALFGQTCTEPGDVKVTYGTGSFILVNTGNRIVRSSKGMLSTVAWRIHDTPTYALEGSIFVAGAAVQWLRDRLGLITASSDTEALALSVPDTGGVVVVPAFTGLGAPEWDMYARGAILGLTLGTTRAHIVRATLEGIAFSVKDVIDAMEQEAGAPIAGLRADGGASCNRFLMQFQSDILGSPLTVPANIESTARGAAFLAGLAVGVWSDEQELRNLYSVGQSYAPTCSPQERERIYARWRKGVARARAWADE
ncbi:MAG TPA: glycerol kinase GlpK [Candidatus Cryosericum sp.]|nr:glycerol kinase GlpK [Candidatus Cryosericum sp.]